MPPSADRRPPPPWALVVFAKAPIPGHSKTRLVPPLTADQAARLHAAFVSDVLERTAPLDKDRGWARYLACAPDTRDAFLAACARRVGATLLTQGDGDLGERLARVMRDLLHRHQGVIVIGTDSPTLPVAVLDEARSRLAENDVVLGPAEDGGYYLIGLTGFVASLFQDIPWGTHRVLAETLAKMAPRQPALLRSWYDIDRPADLVRLRRDLDDDPRVGCPATRALLAAWES